MSAMPTKQSHSNQTVAVRTDSLIGPALNWAVATAEGYTELRKNPHPFDGSLIMTPPRKEFGPVLLDDLAFSTEWSQGGSLIEREKIQITPLNQDVPKYGWAAAYIGRGEFGDDFFSLHRKRGITPLVAAMRCLVASKLGETVQVPAELVDAA